MNALNKTDTTGLKIMVWEFKFEFFRMVVIFSRWQKFYFFIFFGLQFSVPWYVFFSTDCLRRCRSQDLTSIRRSNTFGINIFPPLFVLLMIVGRVSERKRL